MISFSSCIDGVDAAGETNPRVKIDALDEVQRGDVNCLISTCCIHHSATSPLCGPLSLAGEYLSLRGEFQPTGLMEDMNTLVLRNILLHILQKDIRKTLGSCASVLSIEIHP